MLNDMWKAADLVPGDPSRQGMVASPVPNDLLLNLASVDLLLRRPDNAALKQAGDPMAHAESLFAKMSLEDQKSNRANMNLTRGIYLARIGKVAVAKQVLQTVLVDDAENEQARNIIGILGGSR